MVCHTASTFTLNVVVQNITSKDMQRSQKFVRNYHKMLYSADSTNLLQLVATAVTK